MGALDSVFDYTDVRRYLRDFYRMKKASPGGFSYRAFSRRVGLTSPNYMKLVIDGERHLGEPLASRVGAACGLSGDGLAYFEALAARARANAPDERERADKRIAHFRHRRHVYTLDEDRGAYHAQWYLPAIRELVACPGFVESPAWIARRLVPAIKPREAKRALDVLLRLGMLERDDAGRLRQREALVSTPREIPRAYIAQYHRAMMQHASESIDRVAREERDLASLTLAVSERGLERLKAHLQTLRRELLASSAEELAPTRVVQLNVQLFPLSTAVPTTSPKAR